MDRRKIAKQSKRESAMAAKRGAPDAVHPCDAARRDGAASPSDAALRWLEAADKWLCGCLEAYRAPGLPGRAYREGVVLLVLLPVVMPVLSYMLMGAARRAATRAVDAMRHHARRPRYYAREKARRHALAAARRAVRRRTTTSACTTPEAVRAAWTRAKASVEGMLRFGSLLQDLECHVDNRLRFGDGGRIVGRNAGVKGWLEKFVPELAGHYKTAMAYKAAAKKMREMMSLGDPVPLSAALPPEGMQDYGADEIYVDGAAAKAEGAEAEALAYARAIYREVVGLAAGKANAGCGGNAGGAAAGHGGTLRRWTLIRRIDALLDPDKVTDENMLDAWREKYRSKIMVRTKYLWGKMARGRTGRARS